MLIALLEQTRKGSTDYDNLKDAVRITEEAFTLFLDHLEKGGLIKAYEELIETSLDQRLKLAVRAVRAGADLERVSKALGWLEFEEMVAFTFEQNGYGVECRFRFKADGRRWEIDVLATRNPLVICAECKHWQKGLGNTTARRIVEAHLEKVKLLSENSLVLVEKGLLNRWKQATFVPITLSLQPARKKIYRRIPVVSVFELPRFLDEFRGQMDWLINFNVDLPSPQSKLKQTILKKKRKRGKKRLR